MKSLLLALFVVLIYAIICVNPTINGIVINDSIVERDTSLTDNSISLSNFAEKIVVVAPTGAHVPKTDTIRTLPLMPQTYITARAANGNTNRRITIQK